LSYGRLRLSIPGRLEGLSPQFGPIEGVRCA